MRELYREKAAADPLLALQEYGEGHREVWRSAVRRAGGGDRDCPPSAAWAVSAQSYL